MEDVPTRPDFCRKKSGEGVGAAPEAEHSGKSHLVVQCSWPPPSCLRGGDHQLTSPGPERNSCIHSFGRERGSVGANLQPELCSGLELELEHRDQVTGRGAASRNARLGKQCASHTSPHYSEPSVTVSDSDCIGIL